MSATGSLGYRRRGQNSGSFQASSHTVTPSRMPLNVSGTTVVPGFEIPVLVKDVVRRQQRLAMPADDLSPVAQHGGVEERLAAGGLVGLGAADDDAELIGR